MGSRGPQEPPPQPWGDLDHVQPLIWASCAQAAAVWQWMVGARTCPACACCLAWAVVSSVVCAVRGSSCSQALWVRQPFAPCRLLTGSSFSESQQALPPAGASVPVPVAGHALSPSLPSSSFITWETLCPRPNTWFRPGPEKPPYLGPKGIGDPLRKIATLALGMAHHPDVL